MSSNNNLSFSLNDSFDSEAVLKVTEDNSDYCFYKNGNPKLYYDVKCTNNNCYLSDGADWNHPYPNQIIELWNKRSKQKERNDKLTQLGI